MSVRLKPLISHFYLPLLTVGVWLLTSLHSHESAKGMRVKFQDVECFRDFEYEFIDSGTIWNPLSLNDLRKVDDVPKPKPEKPAKVDDYTDKWATELGLRSLKNQSRGSMEEIDLSRFDYDVVDVDTDISPALTEELNKNNTFLLPLSSQANKTVSATVSPKSNSSSDNRPAHNTTEMLLAGNASAHTPNFDLLAKGNFTTVVSSGHSKEAVVDTTVEEDSVEQLTRGDVFSYFPPSSNESVTTFQSVPESTIPPFSEKGDEEENKTKVVVVKRQVRNLTSSQLETVSPLNYTNSPVSTSDINYSLNVTNSSLENVTDIQVEPANVTGNMTTSTSSEKSSWDRVESVTAFLAHGKDTSIVKGLPDETLVSVVSNVTSVSGEMMSSSQELGTSDSTEEVVIYLKENKTNPIKTTSVKVQERNWAYEGTHQTETMEVPDYLLKYLGKETPQLVTNPKRTRKINRRHWPEKGHGMKTKRRKEYKPQPGSSIPFSPRGFHSEMTPRGSRPSSAHPFSDEAELLNTPIVIGVPRPDFSDYELYVPGDDPDHLAPDDENLKNDEYEFVSYKDPYSSHEDVKNFHMDENTQYFLKNSGSNARVYFIAAEEVEWDYAGYGQR